MDIDELMELLYQIYEENGSDGSIPITLSTYSCGSVTKEPLSKNRVQVVKSETGEVSINIDAEDN